MYLYLFIAMNLDQILLFQMYYFLIHEKSVTSVCHVCCFRGISPAYEHMKFMYSMFFLC